MSIKSAFAHRSGAFAVALLALSFSVGGSYVVRAEDPEVSISSLREMVVEPIMKAVSGLEQRLTNLEEGLALFAASFSSHQIITRELCVSDDSGAQTCISKAQLDTLIKVMAHADVKEVDVKEPAVTPAEEATAIPAERAEINAETEIAATAEPVETVETLAATEPTESVNNEQLAKEDQEIEATGSVTIPSSGAALVWYPNVEISSPTALPQEE
jgi:hypothetical protein